MLPYVHDLLNNYNYIYNTTLLILFSIFRCIIFGAFYHKIQYTVINHYQKGHIKLDINTKITEELNVKKWQVDAAISLIDEGCTIPFIARYRKEATGALNDEQLRRLDERLTYLRNLCDRKDAVIASIEEQGKMTAELRQSIDNAETMVILEDLYRPYKQKKRTRATIAKERGLDGLALIIRLQQTKKTV